MPRLFAPLALAPLLMALSACDGAPAREKFPGPPGRTTEVQQAQTQKAVMGGIDPMNNPLAPTTPVPSHAGPGDGLAPAQGGKTIKGTIELGKGIHPAGHYFFLSVRPAEGGPPLAARKEENVQLPYKFVMSAADVMIPGTPFEGDITVTARIKQDPNPLSRVKGDYSGAVTTKVGDQNIKIVISEPIE